MWVKLSSICFRLLIMSEYIIISHCATVPPVPIDIEHDPEKYTTPMSPFINGTDTTIPPPTQTPDYRVPEPIFQAYRPAFFQELERPYRLSPHFYQYTRWAKAKRNKDDPKNMGCYCTTVYKRLNLLAGCAIITTRHLLTTATSTELILRMHRNDRDLENILGAWYDHNADCYNSSMYMTPARIHYHPWYTRPENVNRTHPLPCMFDLAVWAATYRFYGSFWSWSKACVCYRSSSHFFEYKAPTPLSGEMAIIVGFQYMLNYRKKPMPWFKYGVRSPRHILVCPKTEWGWFFCLLGDWAPLGIESGAAWHTSFKGTSWRYDGLKGLNIFSLKLRSIMMVHYFTVLDTHPVLDFLYAAYMGRQDYEFLDGRFYDSQWKAPVPKPWFYIGWDYPMGEDLYNKKSPPPWS